MPIPQTRKINLDKLVNGNALYLQRARKALPYIVRQARAMQPIYYSELAREISIPNPRNLNYPLGAIGNALISLSEISGIDIPPIQCVVVNKNTKLPGEGIQWFIDQKDFDKLSLAQKRNIINQQLSEIYAFNDWDWVLRELGLSPLKNTSVRLMDQARQRNYGGGESNEHKKLKEFVARSPWLVNLKGVTGEIEYRLASADSIDVVFKNKEQLIGIEVKSRISDKLDITRGLFQCVKYKYLLEAEQAVANKVPDVRIVLILEEQLDHELLHIKNVLGVEVLENIKPS